MALTIGDAGDVQTLIAHLYGTRYGGGPLPTEDQVEQAAHRLADRSSKVLMAGLRSADLLTRPLPGPPAPAAPGHAPGCSVVCSGLSDPATGRVCRCVCHQAPLS